MESSSNQNNDFIGASIHCALGDPICQSNPTLGVVGVSDTLPDEPGGYAGYQALFGLKYINPALTAAPLAASLIITVFRSPDSINWTSTQPPRKRWRWSRPC